MNQAWLCGGGGVYRGHMRDEGRDIEARRNSHAEKKNPPHYEVCAALVLQLQTRQSTGFVLRGQRNA